MAVRAERLRQASPPPAKLRITLAEDLADQALEGLRQGCVRNVALVLVEFAGREQAARRDQHLVQFVHHRGLADPGIAGHEHEFRRAIGHDAVEGREQRVDLALPSVQLLRDQQPVRRVLRAEREWLDAAGRLPFRQALPQIGLDTGGGLVALLGGLGEQFHHDRRERRRDGRDTFAGWHRLPRDVAVHPLHRIGGGERQRPRQHFIEGDPQRIEIAAGVDRTVHPAGLFRRHVGERAGDHLRGRGRLALARQARGNAEAGQPHAAAYRVHQNVGRLDVLVDQPGACIWAMAFASGMAMRRNGAMSSGRPSSRSSGSPPGSSSTNPTRPLWRDSATGRAAQAASRSALSAYSWSSLWSDPSEGYSPAGATRRIGVRPSPNPRYNGNGPSRNAENI